MAAQTWYSQAPAWLCLSMATTGMVGDSRRGAGNWDNIGGRKSKRTVAETSELFVGCVVRAGLFCEYGNIKSSATR